MDFVLCGGLAAFLQGSSILTRDVDIACSMSKENLVRLFNAVQALNPHHRMAAGRIPFTRDQLDGSPFQNVHLSTDWGQLDCLGTVKGIGSYEDCLKWSEPIRIAGLAMKTLTLEGIIVAKRAMGRPRDLQAVLELEALREKKTPPPERQSLEN